MVFRDEYRKEFLDEEKKVRNPEYEAFRRRLIKTLEIPTYNKMKDVMYYDVLMKLSHQVVMHQFKEKRLPKLEKNLRAIKRMGGKVLHDDTLAALHYRNAIRKDLYDTGVIELFAKAEEAAPRAQLVQNLVAKNKLLRKDWNHLVDTN